MNGIKFPKMFNTNNTRVWKPSEHHEITMQNVKVLLHTERGELIGDPYFGLLLKHFFFEQNNYILRDQIIDMIYTQVALFLPQIKIKRSDILVYQDREKAKVYCEFKGINQIDFTVNTYQLVLLEQTNNNTSY